MIDHKIGEKIEPCVHGILVAGMNRCIACEMNFRKAIAIVNGARVICSRDVSGGVGRGILTRVLRHLYGEAQVLGNDGNYVQPGYSTAAFDPMRQGR